MLKDIPAPARPREKLLAQGPAALADAELIALLLRTGLPGTSVLQLGGRAHEVFAVLFLDAQSRLIALEEMFRGTLTQTSVYPREIVKRSLDLGAAAVILAHNHPSGAAEPSRADEFLTQTLKSALSLVDVRVLDHLVVGQGQVVSFAERGLL